MNYFNIAYQTNMAALIEELDNYNYPKQFGENGHVEYGWSNDIRELIVQFHFQLNRTGNMEQLEQKLHQILTNLKFQLNVQPNNIVVKEYIIMMYQIIGSTRDIVEGKGEYNLSYMMIRVWYSYFPELSLFALRCLIKLDDLNTQHPYGSWKDIKYFCNSLNKDTSHPLFKRAVELMNQQLRADELSSENISLVAKWVPREKSNKFGWMFEHLACQYYSDYLITARTPHTYKKAVLKCKTDYRKLISRLNTAIDTLQIKQCNNTWCDIDFNKVTSISMNKQKYSFMNENKNGLVRYPNKPDRVLCSMHFKKYLEDIKNGKMEAKGKRVSMVDFTKEACLFNTMNEPNPQMKDLINMQWKDNSTQNGELGNMIAMVDVSGSMDGDPMNAAIALGIRIAEKSKLGKRVMTFSSSPSWVNLEKCDNFVDMVAEVKQAPWGMNTNFHAAMNMILDAIVSANLTPEEVQDMVLVILSDMQMDQADAGCKNKALFDTIKNKYEATGLRSTYKRPYRPPHILFWNLRSTNGFPMLSTERNASMMSGFSPVLLNLFCEKGLEALQSTTPWSIIENMLSNKRYDILRNKATEVLENI